MPTRRQSAAAKQRQVADSISASNPVDMVTTGIDYDHTEAMQRLNGCYRTDQLLG